MRNYRIDLLRSKAGLLDALAATKIPAIQAVVNAFEGNVEGVLSLCSLVPGLYYWGSIDGLHRAMAWDPVLGRKYDPDETPDPARIPELLRVANEMTAQSLAKLKSKPELEEYVWKGANDDINVLQLGAGDWLSKGIDAVLSAILVAMSTTFETLAADLWAAVLNARPDLGLVALGVAIDEGEGDLARYEKMSKALTVTVRLLTENGYNLSGKMGDLARQEWDFSKSQIARKAWLQTFPKSKDDLKNIFDHQDVRRLVAVRNAIVHANGKLRIEDSAYFKSDAKLKPIVENDTIVLDGAFVGELLNSVIEQGVRLVTFVDLWMRSNFP